MISAAIGAILSIVVGVGISHVAKRIEREAEQRTVEQQNDPVFLNSIMTQIYQEAARMGSQTLNALNSKLSAINSGVLYQNPTIKRYLIDASNKVRERIKKSEDIIRSVENSVSSVNDKVNAYNAFSTDFKNSDDGKRIADDIKEDASKKTDQIKEQIKDLGGIYEQTV